MRRTRVRRAVRRHQMRIGLAVVVLALMAAPAVFAKGGNAPAKVDVCHVNGVSDIIPGLSKPWRMWQFGQVISVAENAVAAHEAHGDSTNFRVEAGDQGWINLHTSAVNHELTIWENADCFFEIFPSP